MPTIERMSGEMPQVKFIKVNTGTHLITFYLLLCHHKVSTYTVIMIPTPYHHTITPTLLYLIR